MIKGVIKGAEDNHKNNDNGRDKNDVIITILVILETENNINNVYVNINRIKHYRIFVLK